MFEDDPDKEKQAQYEIECENNFSYFVSQAWEYVDTTKFINAWHIQALCDHIEALYNGDFYRLLISIPPGFGKSKIISVLTPAWVWIKNPGISFLTGSNTASLASRDTVLSRHLIRSDWFQYLWGSGKGKDAVFTLADDQDEKTYYLNNRLGFRHIFCPGMKNTGKRADWINFDDPLAWEERYNYVRCDFVNEFIAEALYNRLNDPATGRIVLIMQRLSTRDPIGYIKKLEPNKWEHLSLSLEYKPDKKCKTSIFIDPRKKKNESLWPEKYPAKIIAEIKARFSAQGYAAQYLQDPQAEGGNIFKSENFKYYDEESKPTRPDKIIQSWDTAFKKEKKSAHQKKSTAPDYSVCTTWMKVANYLYLLHVWRQRVEFPQLKRAFYKQCEIWRPNVVLVEDKASGQSLIQEIQQRREEEYQGLIIPLVPFKPDSDKETRARATTPLFEGDYVLFPEDAPWLVDYVNELLAFPMGDFDDQVDSTTQALLYASQGGYNINNLL